MHDKGLLPVIVGGTNYYIEAVLWNLLVNSRHFKVSDVNVEQRDME